jgi:hypothetical protein
MTWQGKQSRYVLYDLQWLVEGFSIRAFSAAFCYVGCAMPRFVEWRGIRIAPTSDGRAVVVNIYVFIIFIFPSMCGVIFLLLEGLETATRTNKIRIYDLGPFPWGRPLSARTRVCSLGSVVNPLKLVRMVTPKVKPGCTSRILKQDYSILEMKEQKF